jgi:1-acyl-sn-glycerol-3-phosphate acyltransferase
MNIILKVIFFTVFIKPIVFVILGLNRLLKWFSLTCIGIIPLDRNARLKKSELFADCYKALDEGDILILFPEGTRGDPEKMSTIKKGV